MRAAPPFFPIMAFLLPALAIAGAPPVVPQDSLPVFSVVGRTSASVRGSVLEGRAVFPLDAVLNALAAKTTKHDGGRRYTVQFPSYLVRLSAKNPFVVITDRKTGAASLLQLPDRPFIVAERVYVPSISLPPLLRTVVSGTIQTTAGGSIAVMDTAASLSGFDITGLTVESRLNGYLMTIQTSRKLGTVETWLKPDGWLFITIEGAQADTVSIKSAKLSGAVRQVLVFQSPTSAQLTFRVAPDVEAAEVVEDPVSHNLFVTLRTRSALERADLKRKQQELAERSKAIERRRWNLDVIVIDPGHGGKDPGTIGVTRVYEKDIALGIGLKLGEMIKKDLPGVKVVYTRSTDRFIELYRRTQMANEAGGKLFISIHCNAMPKKPSPSNGFEIYLLRPGRTDDAVRIASLENDVIEFEEDKGRYKELTEEEFILVTMAQSSYIRYSETFAQKAVASMDKTTTLRNGGVKQAGFYVLVGASMPNALVETGYLSNRKDESYLKSANGQRSIAKALFEGIRSFKEDYEKELNAGLGLLVPDDVPSFTPADARHR